VAGFNQVAQELDGADHRPPCSQGEADDLPLPIADAGDAVEGPLDPGPVVVAEFSHERQDVGEVLVADGSFLQPCRAIGEARFGVAAQVHDHLDELIDGEGIDGRLQVTGKGGDQEADILAGRCRLFT